MKQLRECCAIPPAQGVALEANRVKSNRSGPTVAFARHSDSGSLEIRLHSAGEGVQATWSQGR
jgi:hypothetical protein